jgi:hypothetical protein
VIYQIHPFGPEVLGRMLDHLERSLEREPRHGVMMRGPESPDVVTLREWLRECGKTRRHHIFATALYALQ